MRLHTLKEIFKTAVSGAALLFLGEGAASAQTVSITAAPTTVSLPNGSSVPMWGYSCDGGPTANCRALNPNASGWSPVVITVPAGDLNINLTNHLPSTAGADPVPTSLVIVGQLGGGLGSSAVLKDGPLHDNQGATWPIAGGAVFTPPPQGKRVQSFATEVEAVPVAKTPTCSVASGATVSGCATLSWKSLKPGTYLLESGTHPSIQVSMGLVGMLVVTGGSTYPHYDADVPLLFSEIDPAQNLAVAAAVGTTGFSETATHSVYLNGPVQSIAVTNGGSGYTVAPTVKFDSGTAVATAVIDTDSTSPTYKQVTQINVMDGGSYNVAPKITLISNDGGSGAAAVAALQAGANGAGVCNGHLADGVTPAQACYPAVVNYSPLYYLINGVAFDRTNATNSLFVSSPGTVAAGGKVLVRMVNAGSRMHVPSLVGSVTTNDSKTASGFTLIAEDGNPVPGIVNGTLTPHTAHVQSEVFMAAGKTYDVMIDAPASGGNALPIFDRQLSLSANSISRDAGMLAYIGVNGNGLPAALTSGAGATPSAQDDTYNAVIAGQPLTIRDPSKGVMGNDVNIFGVKIQNAPTAGTVSLNLDGTFTYTPGNNWAGTDSFTYCGNGATANTSPAHPCATVTLNTTSITEKGQIVLCPAAPVSNGCIYHSNVARAFAMKAPGLLDGASDTTVDKNDPNKVIGDLPLTVVKGSSSQNGITVTWNEDGSFSATGNPGQSITFTFTAKNPLGETAQHDATITFPTGAGLQVNVVDGTDKSAVGDYRWIIEEDRTFYVNPDCAQTPPPSGCPGYNPANPDKGVTPNFGTNFHTSFMPVIATGCTGGTSCGDGQTVKGGPADVKPASSPADVASCDQVPAGTACLDPKKRYYISVLPGDAAQPFMAGYGGAPDCSATGKAAGSCGHGMGGAPIPQDWNTLGQPITVITEPSPYPPATLSAFVFEDDYPLNGEHDAGGGVDVLSPQEPGLGGFQITISDNAGGTGDSTGTPTYDMFNMPLSNALAGTIDPVTGLDACPLSVQDSQNAATGDGSQKGIVGMIITCPTYENGKDAQGNPILSPLAGQVVVRNLWPGRYGITANPGADRIAKGEEWVQTNTLDGQKAHDSFMRIGEPGYFQEFGPAGYHVTIGFASPNIINQRYKDLCNPANGTPNPDCKFKVTGHITTARMSRTPDERLYGSGTHDSYSFTQCYISLGDPDGAELMFTKCAPDGSFEFDKVPPGNWKITTFDQWNDQVVDGITTPVGLCPTTTSITLNPIPTTGCHDQDMGEVAVHQWQANIYTRTFFDTNYSGLSNDESGNSKPGLALVATNIRFRDGSYSNFNNTDLDGNAGYNEVFPLFNWYVIETDSTRYKSTGTHVVYDSGGPADGTLTTCAVDPDSPPAGFAHPDGTGSKPCGKSQIGAFMANTVEPNPLPSDLLLPGSIYCANADCSGKAIINGPFSDPLNSDGSSSTGRIDLPWFDAYGWQGYSGQNNFLEFGKRPFGDNENGGIHGHVVYASTRPFDDPTLLLQLSWEPLVPHVRVNLYKEDLASDGVTKTLTLVDHTETTSFDDWAQGFRTDANGNPIKLADGSYIPNMNCPGQGTDKSPLMPDQYFWFGLQNQMQYLDQYESPTTPHPLAHNSQYKCYDGMHNWNQLQPAPYDGMYSFPSVVARDPMTGKPTKTNCTGCIPNPENPTYDPKVGKTDPNWDPLRAGTPMLPDGKYVVEIVVPDGYELVKEEDKNILIGDNFIAPAVQQFGGLGSIFILPDQASVASAYNDYNAQNPTNNLGRSTLPSHEADTGSDETFWPCVGAPHVVPDYISLFPQSQEVAPFAGATRNLCDRKEVVLDKQTTALAKFYIFTETHKASHYTGVITDDFTAEFDPFSPQFGEKFGPAYLPVSWRDWAGNEISRVYSDAFGLYNGLSYSTWEVNPPNPTGYGPTMLVGCMNDAGNVNGKNDPHFQKGYSQFCYELPFMPGQTGYFDTPVVPTAAFAGGYNNPDCAYPDATPAISEVDGDGVGPWIAAAGSAHPLTIKSLGSQNVDNYNYTGPSASAGTGRFNQQTIQRIYNFGPEPTDFTKLAAAPTGQYYSCGASTPVQIGKTAICPNVTIDGKPMTVTSWDKDTLKVTVPTTTVNNATVPVISQCRLQQMLQYAQNGSGTYYGTSYCGELQITRSDNNNQSVDAVTVTVGGKAPTVVQPGTPLSPSGFGSIQQAIDKAAPGDLLIVPPGTYSEMILMWKPVRLQGVGAASVTVDANPHPAGKLDPWRQRVLCLFGLALDGRPVSASHPYDPSNPSSTACTQTTPSDPLNMYFAVDRLPLEATVGWDATLNGNLAEQLIEPTLMGAYEGAGITVLGKGVLFPTTSDPTQQPFSSDTFPTGTHLLDGQRLPLVGTRRNPGDPYGCGPDTKTAANPNPSNFYCNPSSIDGLTVQNSSQGGGAIWAHAWNHNLEIANNRIENNQGTMSGGITVGQGEHPDLFQVGNVANTVPSSCISDATGTTNQGLPYCNNVDVNVHHNFISHNSSLGDELFSSTPAGAGGVTFCNGSDYYKFNYNFVCGNMSTGDGAGVAHVGYSYNGDIEHNAILFNQSTNPTIVTNGAGLLIMGAPDQDPPCNTPPGQPANDNDCLSSPGSILPSDGTGPGLVINANLIVGNSAEAGSGGGLRLQAVNGTDVLNFPNANFPNTTSANNWPNIASTGNGIGSTNNGVTHSTPDFQRRYRWNAVSVTNNIIANNVAGIDGGGVSLLDALAVNFVNNTVVNNVSTASSGVLLQTLFAPLASSGAGGLTIDCGKGQSCPQAAGLVSVQNSQVLQANILQIPNFNRNGVFACPSQHGTKGSASSDCTKFSVPAIYNDLFWQNRSLIIGVGDPKSGFTIQQNTVTVKNPAIAGKTLTDAASQTATGGCNDSGSSYWDIGVRGDTAPGAASIGSLSPQYSFFTNPKSGGGALEAPDTTNSTSDPLILATYCNGSRVPPEAALSSSNPITLGWEAPPGTNESNAMPAPKFTLMAGATTDEGNNWINLRWGPLSLNLANPNAKHGTTTGFLDARLEDDVTPSPAIDKTPVIPGNNNPLNAWTAAPVNDFVGTVRKNCSGNVCTVALGNGIDAGAFEMPPPAPVYSISVNPTSLDFGNSVLLGTAPTLAVTITNTGNQSLANGTFNVTAGSPPFTRASTTCAATLGVGANCTVTIRFTPTTTTLATGNLAIGYTNVTTVNVPLSGTGKSQFIITPASLNFGNIGVSTPATTAPAQTLTVTNNTGATQRLATIVISTGSGFARASTAQGGAGSCNTTANLNNGSSCTINVVFTPPSVRTAAFTGNVTVTSVSATPITNSPVQLTGNGVTAAPHATLVPASWSPVQTRNCPGLACLGFGGDPEQAFVLTNDGNVNLTGITQGALTGANTADYQRVNFLSNCGPAGGGQFTSNTTLPIGGTCTITVQFIPQTSEAAGAKNATLSVTDSAGTQSSALTGTAN